MSKRELDRVEVLARVVKLEHDQQRILELRLGGRTDSLAGAPRKTSASGHGGLWRRADAVADQPLGSAGLANPMVDRANLSHAMKN